MAGDYIKIRTSTWNSPETHAVGLDLDLLPSEVLAKLIIVGIWADGSLIPSLDQIDLIAKTNGFGKSMLQYGFLVPDQGQYLLSDYCVPVVSRYIPMAIREELYKNPRCALCERNCDLQIDHMVPVSRGGKSVRDNLQLLCSSCNMAKGSMTMDEFMAGRTD
jgi:hypothetical protein